jgi:zinc and cadmium transporter
MTSLVWILGATLLMSAIAWIGLLTLALSETAVRRALSGLVAFAAGSLIAGAFLHLLPEALARGGLRLEYFVWLVAGFVVFFLLEQFLHWRHEHAVGPVHHTPPVTYLILAADGLHNFLGGMAIGASFLVSPHVGVVTWIAAAAHEVPQELGDFAILVHGGWSRRRALLANFASALTIVPGGVLAWVLGQELNVIFLLPFAAGNFVYIAASDLIPEIKHATSPGEGALHFFAFLAGILLLLAVRLVF